MQCFLNWILTNKKSCVVFKIVYNNIISIFYRGGSYKGKFYCAWISG